MVFKQRFLLILTAPFVVVAAYFLYAIGRESDGFSGVDAGLVRTSVRHHADETITAPDCTTCGQRRLCALDWTRCSSGISGRSCTRRFHYQASNLRILVRVHPDQIRHGCIMLGGAERGVVAEYVESWPAFARNVLEPVKRP
jgi:hypothetical protein